LKNVHNKIVTIFGAERSGIGAAKLLSHFGAKVLMSELDPFKFSEEKREIFKSINAEFEFGYHSPDVLKADFCVLSPGMPSNAPILDKMRAKNIPIYSELEVASWFFDAPVIAISGSNGKTTTVNLIHHVLTHLGFDSFLGGNVGTAISEIILDSLKISTPKKIFVVEVSSFQLDYVSSFKPDVATLLNFSPDHLDRYDSEESYYAAKLNLWKYLDNDSFAVINSDDDVLNHYSMPKQSKHLRFGKHKNRNDVFIQNNRMMAKIGDNAFEVLDLDRFTLPGEHNISNALAAVCSILPFSQDVMAMGTGLSTFSPIPHRVEYSGNIKGIKFYNDSKATNIASAKVAIQSFTNIWLILGGKDKGGDFAELISYLPKHVKQILLVGNAATTIATQIGDDFPLVMCETIDKAIDYALKNGVAGDTVLLSPACASFDQFSGYEARGDFFKNYVKEQFVRDV
jgi:UDP-N-acetylmuramoylalanine--D-glutamate ligase